ncbi:MAG TPA: aminotransferase class V-fold PLP-dependent enzyme [Roseococcus sp.]|nr:aminotransferase class V-fold PLP-dependent enzyme [Roseococcus sp.]
MPILDLDANATEPLRPPARDALLAALAVGGNPSSVHGGGRAARHVVEQARGVVAGRFGGEVVFTSGGTEASALALHGLSQGVNQERRILAGATEHAAVLAAAGPRQAELLPVHRDGTLDLDALRAALRGPPALVCAMAANNETGVLHPLAEIAALCREAGAILHVDGVQAARLHDSFDADSVALSAHKLGGAPGAGALVLRAGLRLRPLIAGGGQERGRRGGTEAVPAIAAFAAAVEAPYAAARLAGLRDAIEAGLGEGVTIAGRNAPRLPNTTMLILPGVPAETQVIALDLAGIRVSAGAACSSGKVARSHVLAAMGFGEAAGCGIRVSLPWNAPDDAPARFLDAYAAMRARLSSRRLARAT